MTGRRWGSAAAAGVLNSRMSAPPEKALPAPIRTTAFTFRSATARSMPSTIPWRRACPRPLTGGVLNVTTATSPWTAYSAAFMRAPGGARPELDCSRPRTPARGRGFDTPRGHSETFPRFAKEEPMLRGLMMDVPLLISSFIVHADRFHGDTEIVSRTVEGPIRRYTYRDAHKRARQLAQALGRLGVGQGDRVGTLAWNGYRHFELYYGISGMGAVMHTINPRLFPEQLVYIVNHAEDRYVFLDLTFPPPVEKLAPQCPGVKGWIAMTDRA